MGFATNAIGFFLEVEDALSPALAKAEKSYGKFTKKIDLWNTKVYRSASKGLGGMAKLVGGLGKAMGTAGAGRSRAMTKISVEFSAASQTKLAVAVARAVATALRKADFGGKRAGKISIPRFAKGGFVGGKKGGSGTPKDDILALLSEGERVVSTKEYDNIAENFRNAAGQFAKIPPEFELMDRAFRGFAKSAETMQDLGDVGLDPAAASKYSAELLKLEKVQGLFLDKVKTMAPLMQKRFIPALKGMNDKVKELRGNAKKAEGPLEKLFGKVLGPVRFLAINAAMQNLQENFLEINQASQSLSSELELGKSVDGLVTNFMQMNKVLQLSATELDALRDRFTGMNKVIPLAARDTGLLSEAMQQLVESGIGQEKSEALYRNMGLLAKASDVALDTLVPLAHLMANDMRMSMDDVNASMATFSAKAAAAGIPVDNLVGNLKTAIEANKGYFASLSPEAAKKASDSMATLVAAAEQTKAGLGANMAEMLAGLTDPEKMRTLAATFKGGAAGLEAALQSGNLGDLLQGMNGMSARQQEAVSQAFGLDPAMLASMINDLPKLVTNTKNVEKANVSAADSLQYLSESVGKSQTTFQKYKEMMTNLVTSTFPNMIQFFGDLNPLTVMSTVYLLKEFKVFKLLSWIMLKTSLSSAKVSGAFGTQALATKTLTGWTTLLLAKLKLVSGALLRIARFALRFAVVALSVVVVVKLLWGAFQALGKLLTGDFAAAGQIAMDTLTGISRWILELFGIDFDALVEKLAGWIYTAIVWWTDAIDGFVAWLGPAFDSVVSIARSIGTSISNIFTDMWAGITGMFDKGIEGIKNAWGSVKGFFGFGDDEATEVATPAKQGRRGRLPALASGGIITSGTTSRADDVLALLSRGEMVVPAATTAKLSKDAANPMTAYPLLSRGEINSASTPGTTGDNRTLEVLDAMLSVMKDQLSATRANAPIPSGAAPRSSAGLGRMLAQGGH